MLVDFTAPDALQAHLDAAVAAGTPIVIGTTGLSAEHHHGDRRGRDARSPSLQTANTSLGVNLLARWSRRRRGGSGPTGTSRSSRCTTATSSTRPSGTALLLGASANVGRGAASNIEQNRFDRMQEGPHEREEGGIYYASLRGGSVAGDHLVVFAGEGERIELGHRAESRAIFAKGAVKAALWLAGKPAGRYTMADVLGLVSRGAKTQPGAGPPPRPVRRDHAGHGRDRRLGHLRQSGRGRAAASRRPALIVGVWLIGGAIAIAGAFVYAELAARRPEVGGQYAYLRDAWGPMPAFLYGWSLLLVIQSGGMAAVAITFARYFHELDRLADRRRRGRGRGAGAADRDQLPRRARRQQRAERLMVLKIAAIAALVLCGLLLAGPASGPAAPDAAPSRSACSPRSARR